MVENIIKLKVAPLQSVAAIGENATKYINFVWLQRWASDSHFFLYLGFKTL